MNDFVEQLVVPLCTCLSIAAMEHRLCDIFPFTIIQFRTQLLYQCRNVSKSLTNITTSIPEHKYDLPGRTRWHALGNETGYAVLVDHLVDLFFRRNGTPIRSASNGATGWQRRYNSKFLLAWYANGKPT